MKQNFRFDSTERSFFLVYIEVISVINPISSLRKQERKLLAELMYMNNVLAKDYKDREDHKKWNALFDYDNKLIMRERLQMAEGTFNNCLTALRKKKLLSKDNYLDKRLRIYPDKKNSITFEFNIKE